MCLDSFLCREKVLLRLRHTGVGAGVFSAYCCEEMSSFLFGLDSTSSNGNSKAGSSGSDSRFYVKSVDVVTAKPAKVTINGLDAEDLNAFDSTWNYRKKLDEYDLRVSLLYLEDNYVFFRVKLRE